tara:strand:+ start:2594 stop:3019 length:426 start_codon:yes stop_codon:yes gene_type:complete
MARITIEDCLKEIDNAFDICALAGKRAKDLASGAEALVDSKDKPTVKALREIADQKINMDYFDISNKEKIESQLFGDTSGISEEEVIEELSNQLDELPDGETSPEKAEAVSPEDSQSPDDINNPEEKSDGFEENTDKPKSE